jgi:transcriptional regulator with PAS, ATPase and Fis domain
MDFTDANLHTCVKKYNKAQKDARRKDSDRYYATPFEVPRESPSELLQAADFAFNTYGDAEMYVKAMKSAMAGVKWGALAPELRKLVECYRRYGGRELIGKSVAMCELRDKIDQVAPFDTTRVLIVAETGTGKETVAQQLHLKSPRRDMPFVAFNCASVNPSLLESRFFGHEKCAFTDAKERSIGLFEQAKGGTLFLDEIGELDANAQSLLLRVLEGGRFTRLGGKEEILADVRLVTATNRDLPKMVHDGKFRLDLYERLNIVQLRIPPLRDHKEDIMAIAIDWRFKHDRRLFSEVSMERALLEYDYPGNVRELINILEKSKIFQEDDFEKLMAEHRLMNKGLVDEVRPTDNKIINDYTVPEDLDGAIQYHIRRIYEKYGKNLTKTAEVLKVSRNTVRKYL